MVVLSKAAPCLGMVLKAFGAQSCCGWFYAVPLAERQCCQQQKLTLHSTRLTPNCIPFDW